MNAVDLHVVKICHHLELILPALEVHCPYARQAARLIDVDKILHSFMIEALNEALVLHLFVAYKLMQFIHAQL